MQKNTSRISLYMKLSYTRIYMVHFSFFLIFLFKVNLASLEDSVNDFEMFYSVFLKLSNKINAETHPLPSRILKYKFSNGITSSNFKNKISK